MQPEWEPSFQVSSILIIPTKHQEVVGNVAEGKLRLRQSAWL